MLSKQIADLAKFEIENNLPIELWLAFVEAIDEPEKPPHKNAIHKVETDYDAIVMVTGGLDSTIALHNARETHLNILNVYFDFGQDYVGHEIAAIDRLFPEIELHVEKLDIGYDPETSKWKHILPARNLLAIVRVSEIVGENKNGKIPLYFSAVKGETPLRGGDKSVYFLQKLQEYLLEYTSIGEIRTLSNRTKSQNVKQFLSDNPGNHLLLDTYSCFASQTDRQCGECQSCLRRYIALVNGGYSREEVLSKGRYEIDPLEGCVEYINKYKKLMSRELQTGEGHYGIQRITETLSVIAPDILDKYIPNGDSNERD